MKLCKDCRWLSDEDCVSPDNFEKEKTDYINGGASKERIRQLAQNCREAERACGKDSRWFEPKEPK